MVWFGTIAAAATTWLLRQNDPVNQSRYCIDENRVFVAGFSWAVILQRPWRAAEATRFAGSRRLLQRRVQKSRRSCNIPQWFVSRDVKGSHPIHPSGEERLSYPAPYFATTSGYSKPSMPVRPRLQIRPARIVWPTRAAGRIWSNAPSRASVTPPARTGRSTLGHSSPDCAERTPLDAIGQNAASVADAVTNSGI